MASLNEKGEMEQNENKNTLFVAAALAAFI